MGTFTQSAFPRILPQGALPSKSRAILDSFRLFCQNPVGNGSESLVAKICFVGHGSQKYSFAMQTEELDSWIGVMMRHTSPYPMLHQCYTNVNPIFQPWQGDGEIGVLVVVVDLSIRRLVSHPFGLWLLRCLLWLLSVLSMCFSLRRLLPFLLGKRR